MWQQIKNLYHLLAALFASYYFSSPSKKLKIIGVTGTDGKTTTCHMIYEVLKAGGKKVSLISSIHAAIGSKSYDTGFHVTTPSPFTLQKFLKKIVKAKSEFLVLEVTSHGLDQNRVFGIDFEIAVLTNITQEHLDYHKTYKNYLKAKSKLFENARVCVLNADDDSFSELKKITDRKIITYSERKTTDYNLNKFPIKLKIPGNYNLSNALAAAAACSQLGIPKKVITKTLAQFAGLKGRMEEVNLGQDFTIVVDFAHTPNGLKNALEALKFKLESPKSKLIAVFGAAGERDRGKRPVMGQVAAKIADISVLTAEDPRTEKVGDITYEIAKGFLKERKKEGKSYYIEPDRKRAIELAVNLAKKDDIVATFGKSHEKSMCFGKIEYPWDEFEAIKKAIKNKLNEN